MSSYYLIGKINTVSGYLGFCFCLFFVFLFILGCIPNSAVTDLKERNNVLITNIVFFGMLVYLEQFLYFNILFVARNKISCIFYIPDE